MVRNKGTFIIGMALMLSFLGIYVVMMSPWYGNGRNGLEYSDDMFNSMSKGSAYFITDELKKADKMVGKTIDVAITAPNPTDAEKWGKMYSATGAAVNVNGNKVAINGNLGAMMKATLADSDAMYYNQGDKVSSKYGFDAREAHYAWYNSYKKIDEQLKLQNKFAESSAINSMVKKGVEPSYNYYGIEIKHVKDNVLIVTFLLVFYLIYTMWYGFAIYYLCDGIGITMSKQAKKSEA